MDIGFARVMGESEPFPDIARGSYGNKRVFPNAARVEPEDKPGRQREGNEDS